MTTASPPLCFVLMPFGVKPDARGVKIDFDAVYDQVIAPAIEAADLTPLRADQELTGGLIHKPMYERLIMSDYAVADLTTANANVFYELGVRHAVRPYSTVLIGADQRLPFDLAPDRVLPYKIAPNGKPQDVAAACETLTKALRAARDAVPDSPVFQLVDGLESVQIDRLKTDTFRDQAAYSAAAKQRLAAARRAGADAVRREQQALGPVENLEAGILVDLMLSYRAVSAWDDMIALIEALPRPLRDTTLVREQYGFGLNRAGRGEDAERVLKSVLEDTGPSSETYGLLGRIYKDRWDGLRKTSALAARGALKQAIDAYRAGFEADWRDAYPGVNAVTLLEVLAPGADEQQALAPVVRYAVERRVAEGSPDYWDHATLLELSVIARDQPAAEASAGDALALVRESWEPKTTANNLRLIREARAAAGEQIEWADAIEGELDRAQPVS